MSQHHMNIRITQYTRPSFLVLLCVVALILSPLMSGREVFAAPADIQVETGQGKADALAMQASDENEGNESRSSHPHRDTDSTPAATEESTEVTRTPRTGSDPDETPEATEEPTDVPRTSRTDDEETPEATEEVDTPTESQPLDTFTGPLYGYTVSYDPNIWTVDFEIEENAADGIRLLSDSSNLTIWAWEEYGADPVACLDGEIEYYSTADDGTSDWEPVIGGDGEPLRYESDDLAWAVYTFSYTGSTGETGQFVDYISCETIPGQDAVLMVVLTSNPDDYNQDLDEALDVLDTLTFDNRTQDTGSGNSGQSTGQEIQTNLDGSEYTSSNFGFTANIPLEWQIIDESISETNEVLVVSNGTSEVTLWATSDYSGALAGCVDFAAESSGLDLELDSDASGGEFRGTYRNEAFGNFVYEADGVKMMYFINCQTIPGTDGFLILIHDVEYDQFASERRYRSEIETSIVLP